MKRVRAARTPVTIVTIQPLSRTATGRVQSFGCRPSRARSSSSERPLSQLDMSAELGEPSSLCGFELSASSTATQSGVSSWPASQGCSSSRSAAGSCAEDSGPGSVMGRESLAGAREAPSGEGTLREVTAVSLGGTPYWGYE